MIKVAPARILPCVFLATALGSVPAAFGHTTLETSTMSEGIRVVNNLQIGHACGTGTSVIGTSVVFPEGTGSTITAGGQLYTGPLTDFVTNWGPNIQPLTNRAVFTHVDEKNNPAGKVVGFWAGGGEGNANHMVAYVPFRVNATNINPLSCATSVRFSVSIVDICEITSEAGMHAEGVAEFWTHNNLGTAFDRQSTADDGIARLTITRNTTTNPLPSSCGSGVAVEVKPSAAQIERDMPIKFQGTQVWPE